MWSTLFQRKTKNYTSDLVICGLQPLKLLQKGIKQTARQRSLSFITNLTLSILGSILIKDI